MSSLIKFWADNTSRLCFWPNRMISKNLHGAYRRLPARTWFSCTIPPTMQEYHGQRLASRTFRPPEHEVSASFLWDANSRLCRGKSKSHHFYPQRDTIRAIRLKYSTAQDSHPQLPAQTPVGGGVATSKLSITEWVSLFHGTSIEALGAELHGVLRNGTMISSMDEISNGIVNNDPLHKHHELFLHVCTYSERFARSAGPLDRPCRYPRLIVEYIGLADLLENHNTPPYSCLDSDWRRATSFPSYSA